MEIVHLIGQGPRKYGGVDGVSPINSVLIPHNDSISSLLVDFFHLFEPVQELVDRISGVSPSRYSYKTVTLLSREAEGLAR